jgi:ATP citrate (pro-S)-lyase
MSAKAIREFAGKNILAFHLPKAPLPVGFTPENPPALDANHITLSNPCIASVSIHLPESGINRTSEDYELCRISSIKNALAHVAQQNPWLLSQRLVVKPDMLIKRRGKAGLLGINLDWQQASEWILQRAGKPCKVWCRMQKIHLFFISR